MRLAGLFLAAALGFAATPSLSAQTYYIVNTDPANLNDVLANHSLALSNVIRTGIYRVSGPPDQTQDQVVSSLNADPEVNNAEADQPINTPESQAPTASVPSLSQLAGALSDNSTLSYYGAMVRGAYVNQQAGSVIEMLQAQAQFGAGSAVVAVIDTGVDPTHPALSGSLVAGYDFTRNLPGSASELLDVDPNTSAALSQSTVAILEQENSPVILNQSTVAILEQSTVAILEGANLPHDFGHGTMVSGLIHLVAPGAQIMPLKAFGADGSSQLSNIIQAVYYAADNGANVINMSFSMTTQSPEFEAAIDYAQSLGVICIAAAGNDGANETLYPAGSDSVIGVGSTNMADLRSVFSNYGSSVDVAAPGEALITTYPGNNYAGVWGTSFSSALVAGTVALMSQIKPNLNIGTVMNALYQGKSIHQMMGRRLDEIPTLMYLLFSGQQEH